jgi:hypothetical protein
MGQHYQFFVDVLREVYVTQPLGEWVPALQAVATKAQAEGDATALSVALPRHAARMDTLPCKDAHLWQTALADAYGGNEALSIGLRMALVAIDFRCSRNQHALLRLSLEERTILKDLL